jgi:glucosamine kinase
MSILIADSGATKTEWSFCKPDGSTKVFTTEGLNPYYHTSESIKEVIQNDLSGKIDASAVEHLFFYGAGCDSEEKMLEVKQPLQESFSDAEIEVHHDLLGAARACFFNEPGIACILGTGSNSCLYDGQKILEHIPSLAFVLGDEGSAGYFGKRLINSYFRFELPEELKKDLEENYNMSLDYITWGVYENPQKSRFTASYGAFLGEHRSHPWVQNLLREGFESFITRILMNYTDAKKYEVRFIGSVAFAYKDLITTILKENGMKPGLFVRHPMKRLVEFHTKKVRS